MMNLTEAFNRPHTLWGIKEDGFGTILDDDFNAFDGQGHAIFNEYGLDVPEDPDYDYCDVFLFDDITPKTMEAALNRGLIRHNPREYADRR